MKTYGHQTKMKSVRSKLAQVSHETEKTGASVDEKKKPSQEETPPGTKEVANTEVAETQKGNIIDKPLPTQETLALMAAIVGRGYTGKPEWAVDRAFELWESSGARLAEARKEAAKLRVYIEWEEEEYEGIPRPRKYPAPFGEFLKLLVHGKTVADFALGGASKARLRANAAGWT